MFLFPRIPAECPDMPTCCFLLPEDDYQQFTLSSGPLRRPRTSSRNPKYSRGRKTAFQPQPPVRSSCRLWTLPDDSTDTDVQDLRANSPGRQQKVLRVSSGSLSAASVQPRSLRELTSCHPLVNSWDSFHCNAANLLLMLGGLARLAAVNVHIYR